MHLSLLVRKTREAEGDQTTYSTGQRLGTSCADSRVEEFGRAGRLYRLTKTSARDRYQRTGQVDDLNQAIQYFQRAVEATPDSHPERAIHRYLVR
jgi:hypothetical protein